MARPRKIILQDGEFGDLRVYDLVEDLKYIFEEADSMAKDGLKPKEIYRFLKGKGVEVEVK